MAFSAIQSIAQIDLHSHAITKDYMDYIKANGAEMDEGFPLPSWDVEHILPLWTRLAYRPPISRNTRKARPRW